MWRVGSWWIMSSEADQAIVLACAGQQPHTVIEVVAGSQGWVRWAMSLEESRTRCPIMWRDGSVTERWQAMDCNGGCFTESVPALQRAWVCAEPLPEGHHKTAGTMPITLSHTDGVCCVGFGDGFCVAVSALFATALLAGGPRTSAIPPPRFLSPPVAALSPAPAPSALDTMCPDMVHEAVAHTVQALPAHVAPLLASARLLSRDAVPGKNTSFLACPPAR